MRVKRKGKPELIGMGMGLAAAAALVLLATAAHSQPAIVQKSPADYAAAYDKQLPQPRETMEEKRLKRGIKHGPFARQLVKTLELEDQLPLTASEEDCIRLLRDLGISPLKGWDRNARLSEDDYAVVIGKAIGKEYLVQEKAQEVCDEIVDILSVEWELHFAKHNRYPVLEVLIRDKAIFPGAEPRCPYGKAYRVIGYKPHIEHHKHISKTPMRSLLFRERDFVKERFAPSHGAEK